MRYNLDLHKFFFTHCLGTYKNKHQNRVIECAKGLLLIDLIKQKAKRTSQINDSQNEQKIKVRTEL